MARRRLTNFSGGGAMCGSGERWSLISSMSKKRAPGIWAAVYSAFASRFSEAMYIEPSRMRRSGSSRWAASQSVETRVLGSSDMGGLAGDFRALLPSPGTRGLSSGRGGAGVASSGRCAKSHYRRAAARRS